MKQWLRVVMVLVLMGFGGSVWAYCVPGTDMSDGYCQRDWATQGAGESQPADSDYRAPARQWHDSFGAVAFDPGSLNRSSYGYSSNKLNQKEARQAAIKDCATSSCKIVLNYSNSCVSAAWGQNTKGGYFPVVARVDLTEASDEVLRLCDSKAQNCKIVSSECSLAY